MGHEIRYEGGQPFIPNSAPVIKRTLIVSVLLHVFILIGLQQTFSVQWLRIPLKTYQVDLLRPPMDLVDPLEKSKAELSKTKTEKEVPAEEIIDTISLDTKDQRYTSYAKIIKGRLAANWGDYPREAWENLIEGDVLVLFTINRQGHLLKIGFIRPSPLEALNTETERTIRASAPFPPLPPSVKGKKLNVEANFAYRLTEKE